MTVLDDGVALRERLDSGSTTEDVVREVFAADERLGASLHALLEVDDDVLAHTADPIDRGPLWGMPVAVKDNIDTTTMRTTAGSLALLDSTPAGEAPLVARLRQAGALVIAKSNLSEWSNFRANESTRGWSARGGLVHNPHALDRSCGGSSSGSAAAVAAGILPFAIGTETDASILCPAALTGIVGLKPTVGLVDGRGVIPISHNQDTAGPMARTVRDAAVLLDVIVGTTDARYERAARASECPRPIRVALPKNEVWPVLGSVASVFAEVLDLLSNSGIQIVDDVVLPAQSELIESTYERDVLMHDFAPDMGAYLSTRKGGTLRTLGDLITFNRAHSDEELRHFGQDIFEEAWTMPRNPERYAAALAGSLRCGRTEGIDAALESSGAECLVLPSFGPAWKSDLTIGDGPDLRYFGGHLQAMAVAGYPGITIPMGHIGGLPVGLALVGTAFSEETLLRIAAVFEAILPPAIHPEFRLPAAG